MAGLTAAFLAGEWSGWLSLGTGDVGGRWLVRVGGVEFEPSFEVTESAVQGRELLLIVLDQRQDRRLKLGRGAVPEMIRKRRRGRHRSKIMS